MNVMPEAIELHCQKCGRAIHIEAGDAFSREIAYRLGKLIVCDFCESQSQRNFIASASNWLARSNPNN